MGRATAGPRAAPGPWRPRPRLPKALATLLLVLAGCTGDASLEAERAVQRDIRRAIITSKSLGRYGTFALLQEDLTALPCRPPLAPGRRTCRVELIAQGRVELQAAPADLVAAGRLPPHVPVAIRYAADCTRRSFDFKTFDQVLPRVRASPSEAAWEDHLVRVRWTLAAEGEAGTCAVTLEAAPALLSRIAAP